MLVRYLKCQLMVFVFGGIVGPIFIGVSFFMSGLGRMVSSVSAVGTTFLYIGIAITVLDVVIALVWANFSAKSAATTQQLEANGVLALASVMGIAETGMRINEEPVVRLDLRIEGPGVNTFDVQDSVRASVTKMPMISARKLVVLVDPTTNQFQIDWQRSALVAGLVPAQFSLAEDGRTYDLSGQAGPLMEIMQILKANHVPMNGTIDMRSNPVVRQQVMAVVRRAAAQQQPPAGKYPPPPAPGQPVYAAAPASSVSQRLQELETLRATGTITDAEYTAKRQQILGEL
jgi:hypothetical protein